MATVAQLVVQFLDTHPNLAGDNVYTLFSTIPQWQWALEGGWWDVLSNRCPNRVQPEVPRRPGNVICVEVGRPFARCMWLPPRNVKGEESPGGSARWLLSGGSILDYCECRQSQCPYVTEKSHETR